MAEQKNDFLAIHAPKQLSTRESLVRRGLQEIEEIQRISGPITIKRIDYEQLQIVATITNQWTMRNEPFPGKTYVMFRCDVENRSDAQQQLGKEMGVCFRSKKTGELSYLGDAFWLSFSQELLLAPCSAVCLECELEILTPETESSNDYMRRILNDTHDLLGYDESNHIAILLLP